MQLFYYFNKLSCNSNIDKVCALILFLIISNSGISQSKNIVDLQKGKDVSGIVQNLNLTAKKSFTITKKPSGWIPDEKDSLVLASNKMLFFRFKTDEFQEGEFIYINLVSKNLTSTIKQRPFISVFYDSTAIANSYGSCDSNYTRLTANHSIAVRLETKFKYMYVVLLFPKTFAHDYSYQIKSKTQDLKIVKGTYSRAHYLLYSHPYDYKKQPPFFIEAAVLKKYKNIHQTNVILSNPAFVEPKTADNNDSLFYNRLMLNFIDSAIKQKLVLYCVHPQILFQMKFDASGNLLNISVSSFQPYESQFKENVDKANEVLKQCVPLNFKWIPAKNIDDKPIEYTKEFLLSFDPCWN